MHLKFLRCLCPIDPNPINNTFIYEFNLPVQWIKGLSETMLKTIAPSKNLNEWDNFESTLNGKVSSR